MVSVMKGMRVIEVAEHALVPAAAALLADWGAHVIKIEPVETGDASRGIATVGSGDLNLLFENANRGKRSLALDLSKPEGRDILYQLVASSDVFMTNKLPQVRRKLGIDAADIQSISSRIVCVQGDGQGGHGAEAERGSYDLLSFWHRSGASHAVAGSDGPPFLPGPAFGDFTGAMFLAGGTMGALLHRERTGEAPTVDVSLLAAGMWTMSGAIAAATHDPQWQWPPPRPNPLSRTYVTADGRRIALCCLEAGHYWPILMQAMGCDDLARDHRFADHASILAHCEQAIELLAAKFSQRTLAHWCRVLAEFPGQWTVVASVHDVASDPQIAPNGYLQDCQTASGTPFRLVAAPVQFGGQPASSRRAPQFNEHGDEILQELGLDWDAIIDLKLRGVVA